MANIALIIDDPNLTTEEDRFLYNYLTGTLGHTVTYKNDGDTSYDPTTFDAIVIAESTLSSNNAWLSPESVPILTLEFAHYGYLSMAASGVKGDVYGVEVANNNHHVVLGWADNQSPDISAVPLDAMVNLTASAREHLISLTSSTWASLVTLEKGAVNLSGLSTPERRCFFAGRAATEWTATGQHFFDRCVEWVLYDVGRDIASSRHSHNADGSILEASIGPGQKTIVPDEATHGHEIDPAGSFGLQIRTSSAVHSHTAGKSSLAGHILRGNMSFHDHASGVSNGATSYDQWDDASVIHGDLIEPADATHDHNADNPRLILPRTWPQSLPQRYLVTGYQESRGGANIVRFQPDEGAAIQRRGQREPSYDFEVQVRVTNQQADALDAFYVSTMVKAAGEYKGPHPRTNETVDLKFVAPPKITARGHDTYDIALKLELPSNA